MDAIGAGFPRRTLLPLAGITIVGLALRLPLLNDSLFGDELSTNFVVNGFGVDGLFGLVGSDQEGTPPLFFALTWLLKGFGGQFENLRWVSLLAGLAAIPLTFLLGRRTVGSAAGLVGAAVMALSPFLVFYSTEARAYTLVMLCVLVAAIAVLVAIEGGGPKWWAVYAVAVAGAAYSHYTAVFALSGILLWALVFHPEARRAALLATGAAVLLYLPWAPEFLEDSGEPASQIIELLHPLTLSSALNDLVHWAVAHPLDPAREVPGEIGLWLIGAGAAAGAVAAAARLARGDLVWPPSQGLVLVVILAIATPLGAALHNLAADSVYVPRNFAASSPGFALAAGALVCSAKGRFRTLAVTLVLAGFALGAVKMLDSEHQRPDYAGAAAFIEDSAEPGAPVVEVPSPTPGPQTALEAELADEGEAAPERPFFALGFPPMDERLAARGSGEPGILDPLPFPGGSEVAAAAAREAGPGKLFVVAPGAPDEAALRAPGAATAEFMAALPPGFRETEVHTFPGLTVFPVSVHVFEDAGSASGADPAAGPG